MFNLRFDVCEKFKRYKLVTQNDRIHWVISILLLKILLYITRNEIY